MKLDTTYNHIHRLKRRIRDIFNRTEVYCLTHEQQIEILTEEVWNDPGYQRMPDWSRAQLRGYIEAHFENFRQNKTHWRVCLDGKLIPGSEVPEGRWVDCEADKGRYVHNKNPERVY